MFKAWDDCDFQRKLSKTLTISRVDEELPVSMTKRKPWYLALTQHPDRFAKVGGVDGVPPGKTLLMSEDEVVALVDYLLESETVELTETGVINLDMKTWREANLRRQKRKTARKRKASKK